MGDAFDQLIGPLLVREGGGAYTNRAADRGGPTRWGVTAETLGKWRGLGRDATADEVRTLTRAEAVAIYRAQYWTAPGYDHVATIAPKVAAELFDTCVNMGRGWGGKWLQRSLNLCNRQGLDWPDLMVDGQIGPKTRDVLTQCVRRRGEALVVKCLNGFQFGRYVEIAEAGGPNNDQEQNFVGWISQRVGF